LATTARLIRDSVLAAENKVIRDKIKAVSGVDDTELFGAGWVYFFLVEIWGVILGLVSGIVSWIGELC
jgi:hypothetical protein